MEFHDPTLGIDKVFGQESNENHMKFPDFASPSGDNLSKSANFGLSK